MKEIDIDRLRKDIKDSELEIVNIIHGLSEKYPDFHIDVNLHSTTEISQLNGESIQTFECEIASALKEKR